MSAAPHERADAQRRAARRGTRTVLVGLLVVFIVPVVLAYALNVWWPHWSPFGRVNHGEIVEPGWRLELPAMDRDATDRTQGRWILLHPVASRCDDACGALLDLTRRVHVSLGKDHDRVARMYVHRAGVAVGRMRAADPGLILVPAPAHWFDRFGGDAPAVLVVDPRRQAVLRYREDLDGKGLAHDLARMLKISKIG